MKKSNITFVLFAYNEEKRLPYAIRNFTNFGDVLVLDGGSTDKTKEITESFGAKFLARPDTSKPNVESQENFEFIKKNIVTDWIYWGYVDNIAPKTLVEKMVAIADQNKAKAVNIPMHTYLWGNTGAYALRSQAPFLFHKDYVTFEGNHIHGLGRFIGKKGEKITLEDTEENAIKHFSTYDLKKFVLGHLRYAEAEAGEKFAKGEKFSLIKLLAAMVRYMFIYGKSGWRNGMLGFLIMLNYAFFRLITYTKLYELERGITIEKIEETYSAKKEEMLRDFLE